MSDDRPPISFILRSRFREFSLAADRIREERHSAPFTVGRLLKTHNNWAALARHPDIQNSGAVEVLGRIANEALNSDPQYALSVATLAANIAESLPEGVYPVINVAQVRSHAWKDYGKALRYVARVPEAIEAFERSATYIEPYGGLMHDLAIVRFNLAVALQEANRHAESLLLLHQCKKIFRDYRDARNAALVTYTEGVLLQRLNKFREARETYLLLLASTTDITKETLASLHQSIGHCCVDLGDFEQAEANFLRGIALHRELGQPLQALKGELGLGRLYLRRGDYHLVVSHLRPVRRQFIRKSLFEEAGLCGLEIVQALLLQNRLPEAENLARKIVHEFVTADLNSRAITALAYLAEAISTRKATPDLAHDVREYVISLRATPERDFELTRLRALE
ncbi:MAG: hypothetical protein H7Y08_07725 [Rhizobiaceae bacterium]|nr:hypothetical protein [Rhizobiaceae bacterium]